MSDDTLTVVVKQPGKELAGSLRDALPVTPDASDVASFVSELARLEVAERAADEAARAIRIH